MEDDDGSEWPSGVEVLFDTDALIKLVQHPPVVEALKRRYKESGAITEDVKHELVLQARKSPPIPNAQRALSLGNELLGPIRITSQTDLEMVTDLLARLQGPGDHEAKHLGEVSCAVVAAKTRAVVISDDRGAQDLGRIASIRVAPAQAVLHKLLGEGLIGAADYDTALSLLCGP